MSITDHRTLQSTMDRNDIRGDTLPKDLTPDQWTGLFTELTADSGRTETTASQKTAKSAQRRTDPKKGKTMRKNRKPNQNPITEAVPEKPLITGELPIIGAEQATEKLQASIPGADPKAKSHDKGHLQAERGFMNQHQKPQQPQPRWNLPRR